MRFVDQDDDLFPIARGLLERVGDEPGLGLQVLAGGDMLHAEVPQDRQTQMAGAEVLLLDSARLDQHDLLFARNPALDLFYQRGLSRADVAGDGDPAVLGDGGEDLFFGPLEIFGVEDILLALHLIGERVAL